MRDPDLRFGISGCLVLGFASHPVSRGDVFPSIPSSVCYPPAFSVDNLCTIVV